jgi:hypothetical protein
MGDESVKMLTFSEKLMALGDEHGISLRLIGGLAVLENCKPEFRSVTKREQYHDIDFFGRIEQTAKVDKFFKKIGFEHVGIPNECSNCVFHIYNGLVPGIDRLMQIEVYFGEMIFNHHIPKPYFSAHFPRTIPVTQLLLSKWAIRKLTHKDIVDILMLLLNFEVGGDANSQINAKLLKNIFSVGFRGWGFYKTCTINMSRISYQAEQIELDRELKIKLFNQIHILEEILVEKPKSILWQIRSLIGTNLSWYYDVQPRAEEF